MSLLLPGDGDSFGKNRIWIVMRSEDVFTDGIDVGPCCQIAAVVDGLSCGLVGKIVARLGENCKRLLGDEFDRAGVGCGLV